MNKFECINECCWSPIACGGFGYCREIHFTEEYSSRKDLAGSIADCYEAIRKRKAEGGEGWNPKCTK